MKRRVILPIIAASVIAVSGGAWALNRPELPVQKDTNFPVTSHNVIPDPPSRPVVTPEPTETVAPVPTPEATITPVEPAKTTDELKALAAEKVLALTNNPAQVHCFDKLIQFKYNWVITETELLHRVQTVKDSYASYCSAYTTVKNYGPYPAPGFRD